MSSSEISTETGGKAAKSERLFRSAVSVYCALLRPTKHDAARLDDLALPLFPLVSTEARRYAAAALSDAGTQPTALVRRLADEPLEVSAPLLTRSANLSDVDLIGLIGRHGIGHARAIARRRELNTNIARLVTALGVVNVAANKTADPAGPDSAAREPGRTSASEQSGSDTSNAAEEIRMRLRDMMRPAEPAREAAPEPAAPFDWRIAASGHGKLLSTALSGSTPFFHTALADALDVSFGAAQMLGEDDAPGLSIALRALELPVEQAFLIAALVYPLGFVGFENIRGFVDQYRRTELAGARREIEAWRNRDTHRRAAIARDWEPVEVEAPANDAEPAARALRAS